MKRLGILAAVFVVLLGALFVQRYQRGKIVVSGPLETVKVDADKATRIQIHKPDGGVDLERVGSEWKMTKPIEYPANADQVTGVLKAVEDLKLEDVISSTPAMRGTYQVDSTGTTVVIWSGDKKTLDLVVGKPTADYMHTFVRPSDHNEVYRADGMLSYTFNKRPEDWRDKSILKLEEKGISRLQLQYPKKNQTIVVARTDSTHWSVQDGAGAAARADSATAARLASNVARLMTVGFATPAEAAGKDFAVPDFRLQVEAAGATHAVSFVDGEESKVMAKMDGNPTLFSLYKTNLGNIMIGGDQLRTGKAPQPAVTPAKAEKPKVAKAAKKKKT